MVVENQANIGGGGGIHGSLHEIDQGIERGVAEDSHLNKMLKFVLQRILREIKISAEILHNSRSLLGCRRKALSTISYRAKHQLADSRPLKH
mmetsp:Transcript_3317/g.7772  ORF Transcript_3317/g.7772 Transcript_3317/m.7772 type:complete len:92 (+) Transcript_3317:1805-2080(+)